jgi:hypothetical protein
MMLTTVCVGTRYARSARHGMPNLCTVAGNKCVQAAIQNDSQPTHCGRRAFKTSARSLTSVRITSSSLTLTSHWDSSSSSSNNPLGKIAFVNLWAMGLQCGLMLDQSVRRSSKSNMDQACSAGGVPHCNNFLFTKKRLNRLIPRLTKEDCIVLRRPLNVLLALSSVNATQSRSRLCESQRRPKTQTPTPSDIHDIIIPFGF